MEHKNWNQRPLVEFCINFLSVMSHSSKLTCITLLTNELKEISNTLKTIKSCNIRGDLEQYISIWEIKEDVHRLTINSLKKSIG